MNKKKKSVREAALDILELIDKQQSYSNLLLNQVIQKEKITGPDVGLLTELVYGTIQRKLTLDYYLQPFLRKQPDHWVLNLLRLSIYQMVYLDKIPDRAILFEAVEIAKKRGHKGISSFVNGILRQVQRQGVPSLNIIADPIERLSVETSHPLWLVQRWNKQFGWEKTKSMCEYNLLPPVQTARVNMLMTSMEEVISLLKEEGFDVQPSPIIPEGIRVLRGNIAHSKVYESGLISIQDESSMVVAYALELSPDLAVLDACAAPGGKTGHIAEKLKGTGKVVALDLHSHKVRLINENAARLQLQNIEANVMDSRNTSELLELESFDRVLVDAPCSGLGVLRRKPDIKYSKTIQDIAALSHVQLEILNESARLLKKNGLLIYSTCTVDMEENLETVNEFLRQQENFIPHYIHLPNSLTHLVDPKENKVQILPQDFGGDGFFIAAFKKKDQ
ncbi:16S rRNA (cytosine(967)-C(5))-methyltransferase RsmB [Lederbergia galactosidilytica]|uniref:16S rRNA (cytosine(967)-C(5))-methyltransferase n=1 Tax=Lederbergia galactosidilytica TaxID=217031 RepID=A0A178A0H8_9BACI|nr:16S rRNA (cytosine(967)-C(5))-methyltransferase RsmB [Lederbergia galactosidilytica]MBP1913702.1 16S rRNA (cytosine967-C5)-methyltransferase [Lederbergia galactosidilytica]OAK72598.1 16S rRNA methyltransferase [Lederbergia galactosidilytica]